MRKTSLFILILLISAALAVGCQKSPTDALARESGAQPAESQADNDALQSDGVLVAAVNSARKADAGGKKQDAKSAPKSEAPGKLVAAKTPTKTEQARKPEKTTPSKTVLIVGDSFAVGVGVFMANALKSEPVALKQKGKVSTGLNSPKFYNWESKLKEFITEQKPDALVAMVSGNDAHNGANSASWKESYVAKVSAFLKIPADKHIPVLLVGLPPMGKQDYSERAKLANEALQNACSNSAGCTYVDSWPIFSDTNGNYADKKKLGAKTVSLRAKDGVHFTGTGYQLLSQQIIKQLEKKVELQTKQ
jgi:hypothetical protein